MLCFSRYDKDVHLFKSKVVDSVKLCNSHLFDPPKMDDPYAIRLVKRLHCWNSSSTATGHCRQTHPVVPLVWQTHWEQPLLSTRQFFSLESGCARGSKRANVCLQGKLYNFTFFFWIDFKHRSAICSCIAFNACYWKGFGLASLLALSYVIVEASMLRNCTFFCFCCSRDGLRISTRERRCRGCRGWGLDQRSPSAKTTVPLTAEPAMTRGAH